MTQHAPRQQRQYLCSGGRGRPPCSVGHRQLEYPGRESQLVPAMGHTTVSGHPWNLTGTLSCKPRDGRLLAGTQTRTPQAVPYGCRGRGVGIVRRQLLAPSLRPFAMATDRSSTSRSDFELSHRRPLGNPVRKLADSDRISSLNSSAHNLLSNRTLTWNQARGASAARSPRQGWQRRSCRHQRWCRRPPVAGPRRRTWRAHSPHPGPCEESPNSARSASP